MCRREEEEEGEKGWMTRLGDKDMERDEKKTWTAYLYAFYVYVFVWRGGGREIHAVCVVPCNPRAL